GLAHAPVLRLQLDADLAVLVLAAAKRLLGRAPFGAVAGQLAEAAQLAALVAQGGQHDAGPEARAVLAHAPALVLAAPLGRGHPQLPLGPARGHVLGRVEARDVLADDLVGGPALHA